ncbi:MAG: S8 family serine peptidase [Alphaproteobacteria bacterium]|nr:S8 family serine peptidase [Alphaproteobacteria bacterium]
MKKFIKYFLIYFASMVLPLSAMSADHGHGSGRERREPTEILVKFKKNVDKSQVPELAEGEEISSIPQLGVKRIRVKNPRMLAKMLENNKNIEYIEPDEEMEFFLVPNDTNWKTQSSALNTINAPAGWDISTGANGPIVAVIDSGVIANHPDLPPLLPGYASVSGLSPNTDTTGHGTGVAGSIGMIGNNKIGGAGINWNAKIMPVKIDDAGGTLLMSNAAKGITWAADNGAKVMNCSWGTSVDGATLKNAINYAYDKGAAIFAATGNDGSGSIAYPARYSNVMAVGGTNSDGKTRASGSQYGPGMGVVSINSYHTTSTAGGYSSMSGTSFSSPQVAGLASLIFAMKPKAKPDQVYDFIQRGAKTIGGGYNEQTGYGLIDIGKTLGLVRDETPRLCPCSCTDQTRL